jgi:hypothetical protein
MLEPFRLVKLEGNLWGLALEDEPSFTFQIKPIETYSDEELDLMHSEEFGERLDVMDYWERRISTVQHEGIYELIQRSKEPDFDPDRDRDIYQLLLACKAKGYNPEEDGYSLGVWVGEYLTRGGFHNGQPSAPMVLPSLVAAKKESSKTNDNHSFQRRFPSVLQRCLV